MSGQPKASAQLSKASFTLLRQKKRLLLLSFAGTFISLVITVIALIPLFKMDIAAWKTGHVSANTYLIFFGILLLLFAIVNFVALFFTAAITDCALKHIQHQPYTLMSGLKAAVVSAGKIYHWQLIMTSVGPAIRLAEYWVDRWPHTDFAVNTLRNIKWVIATTFIVPILLAEKCSAPEAVKRSAALISAKWGTPTIFSISAGMIILGIRIMALLPLLIAILIGGKTVLIIGSIITVILFFGISTVNSTLFTLTISALYLFAIDVDTSPHYDVNYLKSVFK